ncbi:vitamin B12-dependent ribonucleotide reductase [Edaphobacter albus]|uniref:vitamin B12-dependent ribonucleotide reductase n=1 Tax=Edaphobacter sp. 4G125 TaxID=2763071 RepID=UPI00164729A6|nr:vitamin B12-dependent ribonucleotide reductase [Edaphobacter sp. 4G125]QNI37803.1 vitamin B12-dependent ribonucleotide reductase [Edaphobacter sp. 4G125]
MATISKKTTPAAAVEQTTTPTSTAATKRAPGLAFSRHFTRAGVSPFDEVTWELRDAVIQDFKGRTIFEQKNVEVPSDWSMTATNIVASKYLHGQLGTPERETGVRQLVTRVAESIRDWGLEGGYFASAEDATVFFDELSHLLLNQKVAFNSPVWFNVGCDRLEPNSDAQNWHWNPHTCAIEFSVTGYKKPQCSACFINSVNDSLDSILTLAKTEGMLFKWGSGTGSNLSSIRGSMETLSGGGVASGPLSFMRGFDAFAGVIKSGGKTRRAAKMVILNVDHPDIIDFIECKQKEEAKAYTLVQAGYDGSGPDSEAYSSIFFQNANNSVRVTDEFMQAVEADATFSTRTVKGRTPVQEYRARDIMNKIAEATWQCGDPGMQYDTTINRWHTSKNTGRINASNPCSEYMFLDDSACNLASFNLLKFLTPGGQFDIVAYRKAIGIVTTAMEIIVDSAGYPTESIAKNSHDYRPLGLGYANLGALLMAFGLPYDSDAGRDFAATVTSILCGDAYWQSSRIAEVCPPLGAATPLTQQAGKNTSENWDGSTGACPGFYVNREPFLDVIRMHRAEVNNIGKSKSSAEPFVAPQLQELIDASRDAWDGALSHGEKFGYRNSQVTVLAPTGTIGFMMDCDTTGIEPDLALVKYKKLVGGGMIKIVNNTVPSALFKLGYTNAEVDAIVSFIDATGTIEGAPHVKPEHLAVFDCSFKAAKGTRSIHYMGHIKMMSATQPFLSGAISKTVNLPHDATVDEIAEAYIESWRQGLKAVAIYRDGSKGSQPLNVSADDKKSEKKTEAVASESTAVLAAAEARLNAQAHQIAELELQIKTITEAANRNSDAIDAQAPPRAVRNRLPAERASVTHKFGLSGHEGYITVGLYPNGQPGEIFIRMAKEGSTVSGLMDSFATAVSLALQHGVPLKVLCEKFAHTRFEPSGWTGNEQIGYAKSIMDYIFRWLQIRFLSGQQLSLFAGLAPQAAVPVEGTVNAPGNHVIPSLSASVDEGVIPSERSESRNPRIPSEAPSFYAPENTYTTTPPQQGIAPDPTSPSALGSSPLSMEDRGIYHAANALKSMVDMGDAPSCATCGAIMTRNGSCYRCMECGSTSGCS